MGVSTDAILAFGFDLGDELPDGWLTEEDEDEGFEFDEWLADCLLPDFPEPDFDNDREAYREWRAKRQDAVKASPIDLLTHCSYDYPMYFLAIRGTEVTARRGYPEAVSTTDPSPEQLAAFRAFCEQHGVEYQEPKWHIFSLWG